MSSSDDMSEWASEDDAPTLVRPTFKSKTDEAEWERKQRNREYRVAARREKRTRKADEKKQRKLNATILRRMTKNPDKYNKNVDRNRRRDIEIERRKIYKEAVSQAERLAAVHDPSGKIFNVGPVVVQEDGKVVSVEFLERKAQAQAERAAKLAQGSDGATAQISDPFHNNINTQSTNDTQDGINPARRDLITISSSSGTKIKRLSNNQQKKLALLEVRPPPPKPVIPDGIELPDGEENWSLLWDLPDNELERRVIREKKGKAAQRKALRQKQKEGKTERRAARDERRRVYREKKLEWKAIKEQEKVQKRKLLRVEQEEAKRIEVEVNVAERRRAMEVCAELGFNLDNVEGVADIKPKALGMKGQEVDFDALEIGNRPSELRIKDEKLAQELEGKSRGNRVDLGKVVDESRTRVLTSNGTTPAGMDDDFVSLDFVGSAMDGRQFEELNYNHKLRRKLRRAIEAAQIQKELLVRAKAKEYCETNGIEVPPEVAAEYKPIKLAGRRILEDGTFESEKQERVRKRLELAEYNKAAKVLRQQAKAEAIEAGLRVFAELTGKKASNTNQAAPQIQDGAQPSTITDETVERNEKSKIRSSQKHRREDEDFDIKKDKSKKSPVAATLVSMEKAGDGQVRAKKAKKPDRSDSNTTHISDLEKARTSIPDWGKVKDKKRKSSHSYDDDNRSHQAVDDDVTRKEKKRLKKEHKRPKVEEGGILEVAPQNEEAPEAFTQTSKKSKRRKTESVGTSTTKTGSEIHPAREETVSKNGEQWNPDALNGDTARKDKFLRLLGGSKVNANGTEKLAKKVKVKAKLAGLVKMENELERQFEAGIRMKHDGQHKKGLGA